MVSELHAANLFREVFFTEREHEPEIDLILQGHVDEFRYEGKIISYGLLAYAPYLWLFGLPMGHARNSLQIGLELKGAESGEVVWRCDPARADRTVTA